MEILQLFICTSHLVHCCWEIFCHQPSQSDKLKGTKVFINPEQRLKTTKILCPSSTLRPCSHHWETWGLIKMNYSVCQGTWRRASPATTTSAWKISRTSPPASSSASRPSTPSGGCCRVIRAVNEISRIFYSRYSQKAPLPTKPPICFRWFLWINVPILAGQPCSMIYALVRLPPKCVETFTRFRWQLYCFGNCGAENGTSYSRQSLNVFTRLESVSVLR